MQICRPLLLVVLALEGKTGFGFGTFIVGLFALLIEDNDILKHQEPITMNDNQANQLLSVRFFNV